MAIFSFISTLTRVPSSTVTGITDIDVLPSGAVTTLYATNRGADLLSEYDLGSDGSVGLDADTSLGAEIAQLEILQIGGVDHLLAIGPGLEDQLLWPVGAGGALGAPLSLPTAAGGFGGFSDIAAITIGSDSFVYGVGSNNASVYGYLVNSANSSGISNAPPPVLTGVSRVDTANVGGTPVLLTVSEDGRSVTSHLLDAGGAVTTVDTAGADDGLGVAGIAEVRHVALPDGDYLIVAARDSSSLSVVAITSNGSLVPVDHIVDDQNSRFQFVTELEVVTVSGRSIVAAAGADGGVSVFELLPGGRLYQIDTLLDDADRALQGVGGLGLAATGSFLNLYVGSQVETGISHFRADISDWIAPWMGTGGPDFVVGTASDQVFAGRAGDDTINGLGGADILMDGAGSDVLTGGAGPDVFVLSPDARIDTITDYNPAVDLIDYSGWQFFRSALQATVTSTATGAEVSFGDELLIVNSHDSQPLTEADLFLPGSFNVSRFPVGNPSAGTEITGTAAAEELQGGTENNVIEALGGNDTLRGGAGDDVLIGGAGADLLDGGLGQDTISFSDATSGLTADLGFPGANTGDATGDSYVSVEHLEGSSFQDNLRGDAGSNRISGGDGGDTVLGREGDDTLVGDGGDDILIGGLGADWIDGGAGRDRAAYWQATTALRIDLLVAANNTGEAAGDVYTSVEDLQGSIYDDAVLGNNADNRLYGNDGVDEIHGRNGDDSLYGGDGDDILLGGVGGDRLDGGAGIDRVAFWTSNAGITLDLATPSVNAGDAAGDTFVSIEDVQGTAEKDNLRGNEGANRIWGGDGRDVIYGRGGDDVLFGQDGGDVFIGGEGADRLEGGKGIDRAAYWNATTGVRADLISAGTNTGEAAGDIFKSIENLHGGNFDDDLRGNNAVNRIWGGDGNDTLYGRGGNDVLLGEDGDDTMLPGEGADSMEGGSGIDLVAYWSANAGLTVSFANPSVNTGDATGDTYTGVENLQGSAFADTLIGDGLANRIIGGGGDDTIQGGGGDDVLRGSGGADQFLFESGADRIEDFAPGSDLLVFDMAGSWTPGSILGLATASGGGTLFDFGSGDSLFLEAIAPGALSVSDISVL